MTDDIVARLRIADKYWATVLFAEAADEIERLRALADQLADALDISCQLNRTPIQTVAYYPQHAKDALARYKAVRGG